MLVVPQLYHTKFKFPIMIPYTNINLIRVIIFVQNNVWKHNKEILWKKLYQEAGQEHTLTISNY